MNYALILANIAVFVGTWDLQANTRALYEFYANYALVPSFVSQGYGYSGFVTSMFLHGGLAHLAGNMLFLFIFGDNLEDELGHVKYLGYYLVCGLGAGLAHFFSAPLSQVPTVGASGAIAGVMGGYLLLFPKARIDIFIFLIIIFRIIPVPAFIVLAVWFAMQILGGWNSPSDEGGVAYWAHAGGFLIGALLILPAWLRRGGPRFWDRTEGHPPHPEARYPVARTRIPRVRRR